MATWRIAFLQPILAMAFLLTVQWLLAVLRIKSHWFSNAISITAHCPEGEWTLLRGGVARHPDCPRGRARETSQRERLEPRRRPGDDAQEHRRHFRSLRWTRVSSRTEDCTRPTRHNVKSPLATREPSTEDTPSGPRHHATLRLRASLLSDDPSQTCLRNSFPHTIGVRTAHQRVPEQSSS